MSVDFCDDLDRQLTHALLLDARAPFSKIADVLGISDQTAARRYGRLRSAGLLRVHGVADPYAGGGVPWLVRIRCATGMALPVAEMLARRGEVGRVQLASGGTEIVCTVTAPSERDAAPLLARLPRAPRIESVTAHCLLRVFLDAPYAAITKHSTLGEWQVGALCPAPPRRSGMPSTIGEQDHALLAVLARDGRANHPQLAAATGWSLSAVRRRVAELREHGVLRFDVDIDRRIFPELAVSTLLWLSVEPAALEAAGTALAAHPDTGYVVATTGTTNLHLEVSCADMPAVYAYVTRQVATLPGVRHAETAPVLRELRAVEPAAA